MIYTRFYSLTPTNTDKGTYIDIHVCYNSLDLCSVPDLKGSQC